MSQNHETADDSQTTPLHTAQAYWEQFLPQAMDVNCGDPPLLDQMSHQSVAKTRSDITPWSWADPLMPVTLRWDVPAKGRYYTYSSWTNRTQVRHVRVDRQLRTGVVGVQTTERFRAIADVLPKPVGDFQASRFFEFPAMLDTKAVAQIVEAVRSSAGTKLDEAAYLRCMLLSETVAPGDTIKTLTHVASVVAVDACTYQVERHVGNYGACVPEGIIAAVNLSYFTALMTRKSTYQWNRALYADEWDSSVAVVPVKMEYSGSRALLPYLLSFLSTNYWTQRVGYNVECFEVGTAGDDMKRIDCLHHAGKAVVGGVC